MLQTLVHDKRERGAGTTMGINPKANIGIAFGGGAARGWAHIGVLQALNEAGIRPSVVAREPPSAPLSAVAMSPIESITCGNLRWA